MRLSSDGLLVVVVRTHPTGVGLGGNGTLVVVAGQNAISTCSSTDSVVRAVEVGYPLLSLGNRLVML